MFVVPTTGVWRVLLASSGQRTRLLLNVPQYTQQPPSPAKNPLALNVKAAEAGKLKYKSICKILTGPLLGMVLGNCRLLRPQGGKLAKGRAQVFAEEGDHKTLASPGLMPPKREKAKSRSRRSQAQDQMVLFTGDK